ncbi:ankyrin repeat domain-containing protein [Armatimonas sp.]|uniref:ankyrin repeat domain-containing protein n=1 Tax=Armatimonas sp. TaxID=1872638 RepID=UPI00374D0D7D
MNERDEELRRAAYENQLNRTKALLKLGADPNATDEEGQTALHAAVAWFQPSSDMISRFHTDPEVLGALLEGGARLDPVDNEGYTPLLLAARNDNNRAVRFLVERGADCKRTDPSGWSALTWFLWKSSYFPHARKTLEPFLRSKGIPITLWDALILNDRRRAEQLTTPVPINTKGGAGRTLLHLAATYGHTSVAAQLLARGADVNATDALKRTTLHYAMGGEFWVNVNAFSGWQKFGAQKGRERLVSLLIKAGATLDTQDDFYGLREEEPDFRGSTPAEWAIGFQRPDLLRVLLRAGADPNQPSRRRKPLLFEAIRTKNADLVHVLLEAGADPRATNYDESTLKAAEKLPRIQRLLREALAKKKPLMR